MKKTKRKGGMPKFPSGKMFGADKEDFVKKRKQKLQTYISEILKIPDVMKTGLLTGNILKHITHTHHTHTHTNTHTHKHTQTHTHTHTHKHTHT